MLFVIKYWYICGHLKFPWGRGVWGGRGFELWSTEISLGKGVGGCGVIGLEEDQLKYVLWEGGGGGLPYFYLLIFIHKTD